MDDAQEEIAVIGIGCNFPGGEGLESFWKVLLEGKNCVMDIPSERFDPGFWYNADVHEPGKTCTTRAALIDGFNEFDPKFFGIPEAEADVMDPQQKLVLQCTYRALEDAGVAMETISGSRTGVYIGLMNRDYEMLRNNNAKAINHYNGTGTASSMAANRVSFVFNLTGPSFTIDSACSSSLVALHVACQAIKQGDCVMALCGGVNCIIEPRVFVALSKAKMISPEGTSKPFSNRADGYGRGEGCGMVLLKPLKNAIRDGNKIWGIISKTAINQDGHAVTPITKPAMERQEELLRKVYTDSHFADVQYIEAHGTGTRVGDQTEGRSIANVLSKNESKGTRTLVIGSLKGNIGHTESAAGVAALIKVLLMMKNKTVAPSVFYSEDSASLDMKELNLRLPSEPEKWKSIGSQRVAGINSFGFGGTNAHAVIREYNSDACSSKACLQLCIFSAASEKSLKLTIDDTCHRLLANPAVDLQALSYTSACGRSHHRHKYRKAFTAPSVSDLQRQLTSAMPSKIEPVKSDPKVVFIFCGNGVSYKGMGSQLMKEVSLFRQTVEKVENAFRKYEDICITKCLDGDHEVMDWSCPFVAQALLFSVQVGLASLLKYWGIKPDSVFGHSVGEVAAAHCSGLLSLEDAVKVLYQRSTLQSKVVGGKMVVVRNVAVEKILAVLSAADGVGVAAFNSPQSCTLSGERLAVDTFIEKVKLTLVHEKVQFCDLDVPAAYHSHMMNPILDSVDRSIGLLDANNMECKLFSTVTGQMHSNSDFRSGMYWAKNIREPVLFQQALHATVKHHKSRRDMVFIEVGPRRALQKYIMETLGNDTEVVSAIQPGKDWDGISSSVGRLFELGLDVDWKRVYEGYETLPTSLPEYQFDNTKINVNFEALRNDGGSAALSCHPLVTPSRQNCNEFTCILSSKVAPYLWEHKNKGVVIVPGSFFVELAYASVGASSQSKSSASLFHLSIAFESMLTLTSDFQKLKTIVEFSEPEITFKIQSSAAMHASGKCRKTDVQHLLEERVICLDAISQRCKVAMTRQEVYSVLSHAGFEYGPHFKQLDEVQFGRKYKEAVATIYVPREILNHLKEHFIHPVVLDYFIQLTAVVAMGQPEPRQGFPSGIASIALSGSLEPQMVIYLRVTRESTNFLDVCGCLSTTTGSVLVEVKGLRITFLSRNISQTLFFHNETVEIPEEPESGNCETKAIMFADRLGVANALKPFLSPHSVRVDQNAKITPDQVQNLVFDSLSIDEDLKNIVFIWGVEDITHLTAELTLNFLVNCCETFRHLVLAVKESKRPCTVNVVTYRSTEMTVDHVSSGFVLSGLTRACAAEMPDISFRLIDLDSVTAEDIRALAHVIKTCSQHEVRISEGKVLGSKITKTETTDKISGRMLTCTEFPVDFVLQTTDPYSVTHLSAIPADDGENVIPGKSVQVHLTKLCVHSSDFFPVSTSQVDHGETIYWSVDGSQMHPVLALDFSGIITAVGKDVINLTVGDRVASCYPIQAKSRVEIPEVACYNINAFPFLRKTPCVSFFILAWEVLQKQLSEVKKQRKKLALVSANPTSALVKVLALTASRSSWNVSCISSVINEFQGFDAAIFVPSFDHGWMEQISYCNHPMHIVFLCSSQMQPSISARNFAQTNVNILVHKVDVLGILQRAYLLANSGTISNWLQSLYLDAMALPVRAVVHQTQKSESYFTAANLQQVVLNCEGTENPVSDIPIFSRPQQLFKQDCVYIVTGGLSGLGLETVKFVAGNGAGCIATLSRRIVTDEVQFEIDILQKQYGVSVFHARCDVSSSVQVAEAISQIRQIFPHCAIKGVFHSAAVLHDALMGSLDESLFRKVLQPKVCGVLNLHYATLHINLDFFVCYSSISSFIGNTSQCNYSAANSFLDVFCQYRRNIGLAGQSINWGPMNVGLLHNKDHVQRFLEIKGMMVMSQHEIHKALKMSLIINRSQQVICKFSFRNLHDHVLSQNAFLRERLAGLMETEFSEEPENQPKNLTFFSTHGSIKDIISNMLDLRREDLNDESTLFSLGFDSMSAMTLQNKIFQETGVNVPFVMILDPNSTIASLANTVLHSE